MSAAPPTPDAAERPSVRSPGLAAVLVAVLVAVLAGTWAATVGPRDVFDPRPSGQSGQRQTAPAEEQVEAGEPAGQARPEPEHREPPDWLVTLSRATQVSVVALLLYFGLRWLLRQRLALRRRRTRPIRTPPEPEPDVLDDPQLLARVLAAGADEQRADLATGTPRNAIVACWHRFELRATAAGLARLPWETPSEFVQRLLGVVAADEEAVLTLADLYREARFSEHAMGESERRRAEAALGAIHRSLRGHPTVAR